MSVAISDVAKRAGASIATVSRVLSNSPHPVAPETRDRVLKAAEELGYKPNALGRAFVKQMTNTIGVIVGDITDPYFAEIVRGVEDTASPHGYLTVICNTDRNPVAEIAYHDMLQEHRVAGIVFAGGIYPNLRETRVLQKRLGSSKGRGSRVIALADRGGDGVAVITVDERAVLYDITRTLVRLGHQRIAYVQGPEGFSTSLLRHEGFRRAMEEAHLDPSLVFSGGFGVDSGRVAATAILGHALPDAVVAATDDTAIGIMTALRQAGVDVPQQVSIAGVDDSRYSQLMDLTTVRLPMYELGAHAARLLLEQGEAPWQPRTILSHRVVLRGSTTWAARVVEGGPPTSGLAQGTGCSPGEDFFSAVPA